MEESKKELFIGIDLGNRNKKTTGLCILQKNKNQVLVFGQCSQDIFGKDLLKTIGKYLKDTKVIAIDAPLTKSKGKGKMRLYEKFLSTSIFKKEKISPIPPALIPWLSDFGQEIVQKLKKRGFVIDLNLIEVFPALIQKISNQKIFSESLESFSSKENILESCQTENQRSALFCALLAFLHFQSKTAYLGYRDGFLFLPKFHFWQSQWREKFYQAWQKKSGLRYRYLTTNLFAK